MIKKLFNHKNFKDSHKSIINVSLSSLMITSLLFATYISLNNESYKTDISTNKPVPLATEISGNEATGNGGGINNQGSIVMEDGSINENKANNGGGIHNSGDITLLDGEISDNEATLDGGGIYTTNNGTVSTEESMLIKGTEFNALIPDTVSLVVFTDTKAPSGVELTDVSEAQNESIMSWVTDDDTMYVSTQQKGLNVYTNPDCSNMFYRKQNIQSIDFSNINTSKTEYMNDMFRDATSLTELDLSMFNMSKVNTIKGMFAGSNPSYTMSLKSIDVSTWNTCNVTNMQGLFQLCTQLEELDVSGWDTSNVTTLNMTFVACTSLKEIDVSNWKTSMVEDLSYTFSSNGIGLMSLETLDVSNWNTSSLTNMQGTFYCTPYLKSLDVSNWDTSKVTTMKFTFYQINDAHNNVLTELDVSDWDTSNVEYMTSMFWNCTALNKLDVSDWNTSKVKDMYAMFGSYGKTMNLNDLNVSNWNTSNVEDMSLMFQNCINIESLDVSKWNTSKVKSMDYMFANCAKLNNLDVSNWDVLGNTDFMYMFSKCSSLNKIIGINNWKTTNAQIFAGMFYRSAIKELDLSGFTTININDGAVNKDGVHSAMDGMFQDMLYLEKITLGPNFSFDNNGNSSVAAVLPTPSADNIPGATGYWYNVDTKKAYLPTEVPSNTVATYVAVIDHADTYMLVSGAAFNATIPNDVTAVVFTDTVAPEGVETTDVSYLQNENVIAWTSDDGTYYVSTQASGAKSYGNTDSSKMFYNKTNLGYIDFDKFDTSEVENMSSMLASNNPSYPMNLTSVDVSNFDTSNVTDMSRMFQLCDKVIELDVSEWNTENLIYANSMFYCCASLETLDVSKWNTSNVTLMNTMFSGYGNSSTNIYYFMHLKELDVSKWNTEEVTNMASMFNFCTDLDYLDLSNWDISKVQSTKNMFQRCNKLEYIDVSNWDTANVQDMSYMFNKCYVLNNLDLSNWNTSNVTTTKAMFQECRELEYIDVNNFVTCNNKDMSYMFYNCYKLNGLDVSQWDTSGVENMNATFADCYVLDSIDVSNWITTNVKDMDGLFCSCKVLKYLDVTDWDVSNSKSFGKMFQGCYKLNNLDTSNWITTSVENLGNMFYVTLELNSIDVSNFNTSNVSNFSYMFSTSGLTSIDVSNFDTSNGIAFERMFNYTPLEEIKGLENFNTEKAKNTFEMFSNNNSLKELNLSSFNTRNVEAGYAVASDNGATGLDNMLYNNNKLEKVHIGKDFSFVSKDGNSSFVLPTPDENFITGADGHWYDIRTYEQFEPSAIESFVDATYVAVNPEITIEIIENPDGSTSGVATPPLDTPDEIPEIPEENLPELIEFEFGKFEANTEYTPGIYEDVDYTYTYTRNIYPVSYQSIIWSQWLITEDSNGNVINTEPGEISISDISKDYDSFIVYNMNTTETLYKNEVAGDSMMIYRILDSNDNTVENAIYLAAYLNKQSNTTNYLVAHRIDGIYVDAGLDKQISEVKSFTETYTKTYTKQVEVTAPSSSTEYVYIPISNMKAEKGMTWSEWLSSKYNNTGITEGTIMTSDYVEMSLNSEIQAGGKYGFYVETYELSGTWKFNTTITGLDAYYDDAYFQEIQFTVDNINYENIRLYADDGYSNIYYGNYEKDCMETVYYHITDGNIDDWYKSQIITFDSTPQPVSKEFYEWFMENAKPYIEAGLYDADDNLVASWDELIKSGDIEVSSGTISDYNFTYSGVKLVISDDITSIGEEAFMGCNSLTSVIIPSSVIFIDNEAFHGCTSLNSVTIKNGVTEIGGGAFFDCFKLTSVTIPNSVSSIGTYAFKNCTALASVYFEHDTAPTFGRGCFAKISDDSGVAMCTFYFKNSTVYDALIEDTHYNSSYGTKSTDYNW